MTKLRLERLEDRLTPSAPMANGDANHDGQVDLADFAAFRSIFNLGPSPYFDFDDSGMVDLGDFAELRARFNLPATVQPAIGISVNAGVVTLRTNAYRTTALIQPSAFDPSMINFTISGSDANNNLIINQSIQLPLASVSRVYYYGHEGGLSTFTNNSTIPCTAYGGSSSGTQLSGGSSADHLFAGSGDTTLRGNGGNDLLYGGAGQDYLYGGAGDDTIHGGAGDFIIPD